MGGWVPVPPFGGYLSFGEAYLRQKAEATQEAVTTAIDDWCGFDAHWWWWFGWMACSAILTGGLDLWRHFR